MDANGAIDRANDSAVSSQSRAPMNALPDDAVPLSDPSDTKRFEQDLEDFFSF